MLIILSPLGKCKMNHRRSTTNNKKTVSNGIKDLERLNSPPGWWLDNDTALLENSLQISDQDEYMLDMDISNPTPWPLPRDIKTYVHIRICFFI